MADGIFVAINKKICENRKIVFVNMSLGVRTTGVNHGIAALVPVAARNGFSVKVIHFDKPMPAAQFRDVIVNENPCVVGFSITSHQAGFAIEYAGVISDMPNAYIVAGGVHATLDPHGLLLNTAFDGACVGEGEKPFEDLLKCIINKTLPVHCPGWYWKSETGIVANQPVEFTGNLDSLDIPDYSVFDRALIVKPWLPDRNLVIEKQDRKKYIELMISRGCPYSCHYCCNHAIAGVYPSRKGYFRLPSVSRAISLIQHSIEQYPEAEHIDFIDDLLIADQEWFMAFAKAYSRQIKKTYRLCVRFEHLSPGIVMSMRDSGCILALAGLESGDPQLRKVLLNRNHHNDTIINACELLRKAGISLCTLNIIGFPFETMHQMKMTLNLNRKIKPQFGTTFYFHPYIKTRLHEICSENNLLKKDINSITSNYSRPFIKLAGMSEKQCRMFHLRMQIYFFLQTFKYRMSLYWKRRKGIARLGIAIAVFRLIVTGLQVWFEDQLRKRP